MTVVRNELVSYLRMLSRENFREILKLPFRGLKGQEENLFVFFNDENCILLSFYTWYRRGVSGRLYYNWRPNHRTDAMIYGGSGHFAEKDNSVWIGDDVCDEGLSIKILNLREHGTFIKPWIERSYLWLINYTEEDTPQDIDFSALNKSRVLCLPDDVQKMISAAS